MATADEVRAVLGQLGAAYGRDVDEATASAWEPLLADVPGADLVRAAAGHARSSRWFPTIAEIRARASRSADMPTPEEAWLEVKREIRREGYCGTPRFTHPAVKDAADSIGWDSLCSMPVGDQSAERAHFLRIYGSFRARRQEREQTDRIAPSVAGLIEGIGEMPA